MNTKTYTEHTMNIYQRVTITEFTITLKAIIKQELKLLLFYDLPKSTYIYFT